MPNNCISLADIDEAISCAELDNLAGIIQIVYFGYWDDVDVFPEFPAPAEAGTPMTFEQAGKWVGNVAMKEGKYIHKLVVTDGTGHLDITDQGEAGGESVRYQLDIERAKMNAVIFGFENATRGRRLIIFVKDKNGTVYLLGDKLNACKRVAADASTTGTAPDSDANKTPLRFQYDCARKLIYTGDPEALCEGATPAAGGE